MEPPWPGCQAELFLSVCSWRQMLFIMSLAGKAALLVPALYPFLAPPGGHFFESSVGEPLWLLSAAFLYALCAHPWSSSCGSNLAL